MAGHSKWAQIKHKKGANDQKRGQLFSKLSKAITLAAKTGSDPKTNMALANAIEQARNMNMPKENIERAIKKISNKSAAQLSEIVVEALAPGGVAIRIKAVTDNSNRTIAEIKKILSEHNSKMVQPGSVSWMFSSLINLVGQDQEKIDALYEALDNQDDVNDVDSNISESSST